MKNLHEMYVILCHSSRIIDRYMSLLYILLKGHFYIHDLLLNFVGSLLYIYDPFLHFIEGHFYIHDSSLNFLG